MLGLFSRRLSLRAGLLVLAALMVVGTAIDAFKGGHVSAASGDAPAYLDGAYHLYRHGTFTEAPSAAPAPAAIGREPGYALFLAMLMAIDPGFAGFTPDCLVAEGACDPSIYRIVGWANLALTLAAAAVMFFVGARLRGAASTGLVAAAYLLFNFQMNKGWADPASDRLAVLLVTATLLAAVWAWQGRRPWRWSVLGLALAALTLVKAVFLVYSLALVGVACGYALLVPVQRRRLLGSAAAAIAVYAVIIGGWSERNAQVGGAFRLTDARSGIALSTREVFDHMSAAQYLAAFVYWTRGPGEGLARRLFPAEIVSPFDLYRPDGFYLKGQLGYGQRVAEEARRAGIGYWQATTIVDDALIHAIATHPLTHLMTTIPVFYRGIWIDEFIVIGLPCLCWMAVRAWRRRDLLVLLLLSTGAFNLAFYAFASLNIPRYQMTAVPALALATALAVSSILERKKKERPETP